MGMHGDQIADLASPMERWQRVLNERFPPHARRLADRSDPIRGQARVVWERDGEQWVPGVAIRWDRQHVLVQLNDLRCTSIGVWLPPTDFRRTEPPAASGGATVDDAGAVQDWKV
jgi:hypothetical protein